MPVLERLRRCKRKVAFGLLPLLVAVWSSVGACPAMAAAAAVDPGVGHAASLGADGHEHEHERHAADTRGHHAAVGGEHPSSAADSHSPASGSYEQGACPHCALGSGAALGAEHAACAASDDATAASHSLQWDSKLPLVVPSKLILDAPPWGLVRIVDRYGGALAPQRSLHLRHCVFLI